MDPLTVPAASCTSPEELRAHLDALDRRIIAALTQRAAYTREASRFTSTGKSGLGGRARAEALVARVRALAGQLGGDPDLVEAVYRVLADAEHRPGPVMHDVLQAEAMLAR